MSNKTFTILIVPLIIASIVAVSYIILKHNSTQEKKEDNLVFNTSNNSEASIKDKTEQKPKEPKTFEYSINAIEKPFSLKYSADYSALESDATGQWDITLSKKEEVIFVDLSGVGTTDINQAVNLWINGFDNIPIEQEKNLSEQGVLKDKLFNKDAVVKDDLTGRYSIITIISNGVEWSYLIVDMGNFNVENSRTYLMFKSQSSNLEKLQSIAKSIEYKD